MKKILLTLMIASASFTNAQTLFEDNFNALTVGNVSTETAGTVAGQGGYFLFSNNGTAPTTSTNSDVTNAQIVATGTGSTLGLMLEGPDGDKGARYMWKDGLPAIWATRTVGNEIIEIEVDINPGDGATSTSRNNIGIYIFNAAGTRILAGFHVRVATRELFLVAYSTPASQPVGNYNYSLAAAPGIQLPADTFSRVGVSYNKTTGVVRIKGPGIPAAGLTVNSSSLATDPGEIDFIAVSGHAVATPNIESGTMVMDNFIARASATDTLLGLDEVSSTNAIAVFPNPANDFVTVVSSAASIASIEMTDINGRTVKKITNDSVEAQINISDLTSGVYILKVTSSEGNVTTKKLVKE